MYIDKTKDNILKNNGFLGLIAEESDLCVLFNDYKIIKLSKNAKVKSLIGKKCSYAKDLGLDETISNKKVSNLSSCESKLVMLIKIALLKPEFIILNNFDLGFNYKDKSRLSRFIKTINATYGTIFIIITNDLLFMNKCVKHIIIIRNKIIKYQGDIMSAIKEDLLEKPPIINFIDMANTKGAKLDYTLDSKELLKGIYRSVF